MSHAIVVHEVGGPEVMKWEEVSVGDPGPGEIRIRHTAVGLNFIDVYFRTGLYKPPGLPFTPGMEAAGVVEAVGPDVDHLRVGDRIAYANGPPGSYCEERVFGAEKVVKIPAGISDETAAGMMLKGMTAQYLLRQTFPVKSGDTILIQAAAGGVGLIVCQWARHLGATVIGTVGSQEKAELAKAHGCQHTILYKDEDFVERVKEITDGKGVDVVYDSVGQATFLKSLDCLRPRGMLVSFGQSSGSVETFNPGLLAAKGSLFLTRPTLFNYIADRPSLEKTAGDLFDVVGQGVVKIEVQQTFPLIDAAKAHETLESRKTTGSTVLIPD